MTDAVTNPKREVVSRFYTPLISRDGENFRIFDGFTKPQKKKAVIPKKTLVDGGTSSVTMNDVN